MIKISFHLNKHKKYSSAKDLVIMGKVSYHFNDQNGKQSRSFKFSTGESGPVKKFKNSTISSPNAEEARVNLKLSEYKQKAIDLYNSYAKKKEFPSPAAFKIELTLGGNNATEERDLINDFRTYIESLKASSKSNVYNNEMALKRIIEFSIEEKYPVSYSNIDMLFYGRFKHFNIQKKGKKPNTFGMYINKLKTFLNEASVLGWNKYNHYKSKKFKIIKEAVPALALDKQQINDLVSLDLLHRPQLGLNRDYFILGCETGLRYCDYTKIKKTNIREVENGYNLNLYKTQKTKIGVTIPLSRTAMDILIKYDFNLPPPPSNTNINVNLKVLAQLAGINFSLASHCGRRSFATIQYKSGTPVHWIMKITGHKTEKSFYTYIGVDLEENADLVRGSNVDFQIEKRGLLN